jgi:hypothetical protein
MKCCHQAQLKNTQPRKGKKCLEEKNMTNKPTFGKIAHNVYITFTDD